MNRFMYLSVGKMCPYPGRRFNGSAKLTKNPPSLDLHKRLNVTLRLEILKVIKLGRPIAHQ